LPSENYKKGGGMLIAPALIEGLLVVQGAEFRLEVKFHLSRKILHSDGVNATNFCGKKKKFHLKH
jgi:hypothetical protein